MEGRRIRPSRQETASPLFDTGRHSRAARLVGCALFACACAAAGCSGGTTNIRTEYIYVYLPATPAPPGTPATAAPSPTPTPGSVIGATPPPVTPTPTPTPPPQSGFAVTPSSYELTQVGAFVQLTAADSTGQALTAESSAPSVATVARSGSSLNVFTVTATGPGVATITVTNARGQKAYAQITVTIFQVGVKSRRRG